MRRRAVLVALGAGAAGLAGCVSGGTAENRNDGRSDEDSVAAHFDGEPVRPGCEYESGTVEIERDGETESFETAETVPYPRPPSEFTTEEVVGYVDGFEEAHVTHDAVCPADGSGYILSVMYSVRDRATLDWYEDIETVFLLRAGMATAGIDDEGRQWVADVAWSGVVYGVDGTGVARAEFYDPEALDTGQYGSQAPDPLEEGELVATFE